MRKIALLAFLAALAAAPAAAGGISLYASRWDTDAAGRAYGGGLRLGFPLGRALGLEVRATYHEELSAEPLRRFDLDALEALPLDLGLRIDLSRRDILNPYLGGGASYVLLDSDAGEVDHEVGWYGLFGVELGKLFVEANYRRVEATVEPHLATILDPGQVAIPDRVEVDLSGLAVHVGWIWKF